MSRFRSGEKWWTDLQPTFFRPKKIFGETFLPYKEKNPAAKTRPLDSKSNIYVDNSQEQTCQAEYIQRSL